MMTLREYKKSDASVIAGWLRSEEQGYELALLVKTAELNRSNQMMAVVDADAKEEIELYMAAGFTRMEGQNSITAYIR